MKTVQLYYYEYCDNNLGVWNREWDSNERDLEQKRKRRAEGMGINLEQQEAEDPEGEDLTGEYGDIGLVVEVDVTLSLTGVLDFANEYGLGGD